MTKPTFGISSDYAPKQYPKALHNDHGKSALAHDPDHQKELEIQGYRDHAPKHVQGKGGNAGGGVDTGYVPQAYPKVLHGKKGATVVANDPDHEAFLAASGWTPEVHVAAEAPKPLQAAEKAEFDALQAEHQKLQAEIKQLKAKK